METTLLSLFWWFSAAFVFIFHFVIVLCGSKIPDVLRSAYLFGKLKTEPSRKLELEPKTVFPIPKSWFTHFYGFGIAVHSIVFAALSLHLYKKLDLSYINNVWKVLNWPNKEMTERNAFPVLTVFLAEWVQISRRLYECLFTSSFSKSTMSIIHYFLGVFFYTSFGLGLLASVDIHNLSFHPVSIKDDIIFYLLPMVMFIGASYFQHRAMLTFAGLRKTGKGKYTKGHFIPKGHLFQWVSCPHYLCEMIIYFSLSLVFKMRNGHLNSVLAFVVVNQLSSSLMSHKWYQNTFKSYPKSRKAVIPYIL